MILFKVYEINSIVYFLYENKVCSGKIKKIIVSLDWRDTIINYIIDIPKLGLRSITDPVFLSKEELINSLR